VDFSIQKENNLIQKEHLCTKKYSMFWILLVRVPTLTLNC